MIQKFKKNGRFVINMALFFSCYTVSAQQDYFQQKVDYKLNVVLHDENSSLSAFEEISYVNNSPKALEFIYFHLWPNAYKNNSTALAKQLLWQGKTALYFSKPEERGFIDSLDFKVNGKTVKWEYDKEHIDICKLILNEPLKPSDSLLISTPFYLKIPDAKFSRLGHTEQAYYMTQWYPKPAVFDRTGWHQMPYLDQGEFFSEYGSFDVKITLPDNYVLCATGDKVSNPDEEDFIKKKIADTEKEIERQKNSSDKTEADAFTPASSKLFKTVEFKQSRVHDFAWFADKRFYVLKGEAVLPHSKRTVNSWVYFTPKNFKFWKDAIEYVNQSTIFYSFHNGDYPYNNVSAVDGSIMAGGGMEYPNITVIGNVSNALELDMVITHEVGHNWFYGILGSNERDTPFLDEGINSFYEIRYLRAKHPEAKVAALAGKDSTFKLFGLNKIPYWKYQEIPFYINLRMRKDQPIALHADEYTESNYGGIVYGKTALVMDYLLDYLGEPVLDSAMRIYFENFKFKHPTPNDLFKTLEAFSGKDLRDFQKYLIYSTDHIDYKIKKAKHTDKGYALTLKNKTGTLVPFNVYAFDKNNKVLGVHWFDGFDNKRIVNLPEEAHHFKIDGQDRMPDINRKNNGIKAQGLFKHGRPLRFSFLSSFEEPSKIKINYSPVVGGNFYNGPMLGLALHNYGFYEKRFEYLVAPMYAFNTKSPVGFAEFNLNFYPKSVFRFITFGTKAKTFAYDFYNTEYLNSSLQTNFKDLYLNYYKIAPYLKFEFRKKDPTSKITQQILYTNNTLFTDSIDPKVYSTITVTGPRKKTTYSFVNSLTYDLNNARTIDPFRFIFNLQHTGSMAKVSAAFNYQFTLSKKSAIELRLFAGAFLAGNLAERSYYAFRASGYNGWQDYTFEGNYLARNERNGVGFSQFMEKDGALRIWTPLGQTPEWMTSVNVKSPKFLKLFKVFADAVVCDARALNKEKFLWDAGLNIIFWNEIIEVYIPLAYSTDIKNTLELNKVSFPNTIRFIFNIHKLAVKNLLQNSFF